MTSIRTYSCSNPKVGLLAVFLAIAIYSALMGAGFGYQDLPIIDSTIHICRLIDTSTSSLCRTFATALSAVLLSTGIAIAYIMYLCDRSIRTIYQSIVEDIK